MKLFIRLEAPYEWVRVNNAQVESFGEVDSLDDYPTAQDAQVIGVVSGEWVANHQVSLPAKTRKLFNVALPYALEEAVSQDIDEVHLICTAWKAGAVNNVLVVAKSKMQEWLTLVNQHNLPVEQLLPDYLLLPFHDSAACSLAQTPHAIITHRNDGQGASLDPELLDVWMMDVPPSDTIAVNDQQLTEQLISQYPDRDFRHWEFGTRMAHWLGYQANFTTNLWGDQYRPTAGQSPWRVFQWPALLLVVAVLGVMLYDSYRYLNLHAEINNILNESTTILQGHFPEFDNIDPNDARALMQRAIENRSGVGQALSVQEMLSDVAVVLRRFKVSLSDIAYRDMQLTITCLLGDFAQVDRIVKQLNAPAKLNAELKGVSNDKGKVIATYIITAK